MDYEKIKEGVRLILEGIGEDPAREGLLETPDRIARMCTQIYGGLTEDASAHLSKQFSASGNNIVLEKDITFYSMCEHHLLPFYGKAHVAYIPDGKVAGLSKLARTVEVYARRPQIQENMTAQIADALEEYLQPKGVMVMIEASPVRQPPNVTGQKKRKTHRFCSECLHQMFAPNVCSELYSALYHQLQTETVPTLFIIRGK